MIQKQMLGAVLGVAVVALVTVMVWMQFRQDTPKASAPSKTMTTDSSTAQKTNVPVPENVDDITASIVSESRVDATALDDEESGMLEEVNADSESVNNLGTSYDQNSF